MNKGISKMHWLIFQCEIKFHCTCIKWGEWHRFPVYGVACIRFFGELEANYFFYTEAVAYGALLRCLYVVVCMVNKAGTFL